MGRSKLTYCKLVDPVYCPGCNQTLSRKDFYIAASRSTGITSTCKICDKLIASNRLTRRNAERQTVCELDNSIKRLQEILVIKQGVLKLKLEKGKQ